MRRALFVVAVLVLAGLTSRAGAERGEGVPAQRVRGAGAGVNDVTERVNRSMALDPGGTLKLKNFSGRVTITAYEGAEVVIDALRRADRDRLANITLDVQKEGNTIVVDANRRDRSWSDRDNNVVETAFDIKVPRRTNLDLQVFSSPVEVSGVEGSQKVHSFSAGVRLNGVGWTPRQSIDVETFSGSIEVQLPAAANATVSFNSFSGDLKSDIPLTLRSSSRRSFTAELGNGSDGRVRFKTFSGNVRINR
jgi:putative adhesin